jgi:hypothetical protein
MIGEKEIEGTLRTREEMRCCAKWCIMIPIMRRTMKARNEDCVGGTGSSFFDEFCSELHLYDK